MSRLEKLERLASAAIALKDHMDNTPYSDRMSDYTREEFLAACDKYRANLHILDAEYLSALSEVKGDILLSKVGGELNEKGICDLASYCSLDTHTGMLAEIDRLRGAYDELIYAVGIRCRHETRHQTALRYIQQAEGWDSGGGRVTDALPTPAPMEGTNDE